MPGRQRSRHNEGNMGGNAPNTSQISGLTGGQRDLFMLELFSRNRNGGLASEGRPETGNHRSFPNFAEQIRPLGPQWRKPGVSIWMAIYESHRRLRGR